ncbi:hypothetical protein NGRA_2835 [Nosema granulosis]|uniref:Uncharacterized protein n=1 Tax=Nosema granulosis TaxID=83296 RepID=A0A9P6GVU9_9MICR|nr:hypothetical protein NGRA_2835 [Nosema granulosis]
MESKNNKHFYMKHDKMSSSSINASDLTMQKGTQSNRTATYYKRLGPLHLTNPMEAKQIKSTYKSLTFTTKIDGISLAEPPQIKIHMFTDPNVQDHSNGVKKYAS